MSNFHEFESLLSSNVHTLGKVETKQDISDYIDLSKDGIWETIVNIRDLHKNYNVIPRFSVLLFLKALIAAPRRLFGSILRLVLMNSLNDPLSIVKRGIKVDYFNIKKANNDL